MRFLNIQFDIFTLAIIQSLNLQSVAIISRIDFVTWQSSIPFVLTPNEHQIYFKAKHYADCLDCWKECEEKSSEYMGKSG